MAKLEKLPYEIIRLLEHRLSQDFAFGSDRPASCLDPPRGYQYDIIKYQHPREKSQE